jgi:hypothetical protein
VLILDDGKSTVDEEWGGAYHDDFFVKEEVWNDVEVR